MVAGNLVKRCRLSSVWGDCLFEQFGIGHLLQPIYLFLTVLNGPEMPNSLEMARDSSSRDMAVAVPNPPLGSALIQSVGQHLSTPACRLPYKTRR